MSYTISERFKNLERSTDWVSDQELRDSIQEHGCVYPLVIWKEEGVLVDGHRRNAICQELSLVPVLVHKSFDSEESAVEWAKSQQWHRRNLTPEEVTERRAGKIREMVSDTPPEERIHVDTPNGWCEEPVGARKISASLGIPQTSVTRGINKIKLADSLPEDLRPIVESMTVKQVTDARKLGGQELEQFVRRIANPQPEDGFAAKFDATLSHLNTAHRSLSEIEKIAEMAEFYTPGVATRVKHDIASAKATLSQIRPEVHNLCGGIGCELCNQRGWTTKANNHRKI